MQELNPAEILVRALPNMLWDKEEERAVSHAFMHKEISVSRPAVLTIEEISVIFHLDLVEPGERIEYAAFISVENLTAVVNKHVSARGVRVVEDPIKDDPKSHDNPSHALIKGYEDKNLVVQKEFSKGLARSIIKELEYRILP